MFAVSSRSGLVLGMVLQPWVCGLMVAWSLLVAIVWRRG